MNRLVFHVSAGALCLCSALAQAEPGTTYTVRPGTSIQEAVDKAGPGDTIQVLPGVYIESIAIASDDIRVRGMEYEGERAVIRAKAAQEEEPLKIGVSISGNGVTVEGLIVEEFAQYGVHVDNVTDLILRDMTIRDCGAAGVATDDVTRATLDRVTTRGGGLAGIWLNESLQVSLFHCESYAAAFGLYVRNSQQTVIESSVFHRNGAGLVLHGTESDEAATTSYTKALRSRFTENNSAVPPLGEGAPDVPPGIGIAVWGAVHTEIAESDIAGNGSMGLVVMRYQENVMRPEAKTKTDGAGGEDGIIAQHTYVHDNR